MMTEGLNGVTLYAPTFHDGGIKSDVHYILNDIYLDVKFQMCGFKTLLQDSLIFMPPRHEMSGHIVLPRSVIPSFRHHSVSAHYLGHALTF